MLNNWSEADGYGENAGQWAMNDVSEAVSAAREYDRSLFPARSLWRALELHPLLRFYRRQPPAGTPADFACNALEELDISVKLSGTAKDAVPAQGPLLLAANHPFGGVEGLVLAAWAAKLRPDLKIIANEMLCRIPELRPLIIGVNVFKGKGGADNISGLRAALAHLESGGALALFPSGVVSHWHREARRVIDPKWNPLVGRLARVAGASVVPLYFEGRNSLVFQAAGYVHPGLRTLLLPGELWCLRGNEVRLRIGEKVEPDLLSALRNDTARAAYIRARCYALGRTDVRKAKRVEAIADESGREALLKEIQSLPPERLLAEEGKFRTFYVNGKESPHILREIGRLRERAFRAIQEGSGKALDLDRFDPHYTHLIVWDRRAGAVAGGYRARSLSSLTPPGTMKTLYTASLFRFKREFFERCGTSMELGRAFVTPEYQRDYAPLLMLWKGIGRFAAETRTRTLFGPSSIGLGYTPESIFMLRQHLEECCGIPELAALVRGRRAPRPFSGPNAPDAHGLEYRVLDRAVRGLEGDKGLPILFKHYLQLGGRIAAFHEDRKFGTLDALMVVDLTSAPEKLLLRYMGEERLRMLRLAHNSLQRP